MPSVKPAYGVYTPLVTFFNEDESIDFDSLKAHVRRMAEAGVVGLVLQGSNGEAPHLDHHERRLIVRTTREYLNELQFPKVELIVGCSAASVRETLSYVTEAKESGADYALVLPPSYWSAAMTPGIIEGFFSAVSLQAVL
jgi:4-hydroxy-2-oxoglutarate aldolase